METIINYIWGLFVSEDAVAGLTGKERNLITKSWNKIMQQPTQNGILFFMRLFEIQPKHQSAFPFRDIATKDLPNNNMFKAHVNSVMYSISSIVSNLRDEELFMAILNKLGTSHATRSVDRQALIDVKQALFDTAKFMGKSELAAWNKLMDVFIDVVSKAIEAKIKENIEQNS